MDEGLDELFEKNNWDVNEKVFTAWFPQCCPPSILTRSKTLVKEFLNKKYKVNSPVMLYGGSVTTDNVVTLGKIGLISGFLIGGASLKSTSFIKIIKNYFK